MSVTERTDAAIAFLHEIYNQGYTPMFYASKNEMEQDLKWETSRIEERFKIWVSQYPAMPYPETAVSSYSGKHDMWQYTNNGIVAGIDKYMGIANEYPVFESLDKCDVEGDVIIDFSNASSVDGLLDYCVEKNVPVVLCTTGLSEVQLAKVQEASKKVAILKSANQSVEEEDVKACAREVAAAQLQQYGLYGMTDEQLDGFAERLLKDERQRENLLDRAVENKVFAIVKESVKLDEQSISMDDFQKLFEN
jgi:hypothetical protein